MDSTQNFSLYALFKKIKTEKNQKEHTLDRNRYEEYLSDMNR